MDQKKDINGSAKAKKLPGLKSTKITDKFPVSGITCY